MAEQKEPTEYDRFLRFKVMRGFRTRGYPLTKEYQERIDYELDIICQMSYAPYFLIVADLCNWMERQGILFIVRGSGCGSLVVWGLGISHAWLDPIEYGLPFERFLNPSRVSMPDLDIDIQDDRRDEVVQYTIDKYGRERVAKIVTFGTLAAKMAIKDMARAMQITNYEKVAEEITQFIPGGKGEDGKNIRIGDELKRNEALRECQKKYPELFGYAMRVEGKIRNASIHAAGTVIAPEKMTKFLPTIFWGNPEERSPEENFPTTQWDMYDVEERGLLKMDYLGLKTLRVIAQTCKLINLIRQMQGQPADFDINKIDRRDAKTWKDLGDGKTVCVFQIEKSFVQGYAKRMNLGTLCDPWQLAVLVAIIRPGMMDSGNTERYLRRASGQEEPVPLHPLLAETFKKTYGLMCFQEDVMWAARVLCGFTMAKADVLRKGVGKKNPAFIAKMKPDFEAGAKEHGVTQEDMDRIWANIEDHSRYSFNNAHAAAYGMVIAYWTAYLKSHYPLTFMQCMINSEAGRGDKIEGYNFKVSEYVEEARSLGIKIIKPSIRQPTYGCSIAIKDNAIHFGLGLIKRVTAGAVAWIATHSRDAKTFKDFVLAGYEIRKNPQGIEAPYSMVSRTEYEMLISAGAMDCFEGGNRAKMLAMLPKVLDLTQGYHEQVGKVKAKVEAGKSIARMTKTPDKVLADLGNYVLEEWQYKPIDLESSLETEQEITGCFLSESPFQPFSKVIGEKCDCTVGEVRDGTANQDIMTFAGVLIKITKTVIKNGKNKGQEMGFVGFTGRDGQSIEAVVFSNTWRIVNTKTTGLDGKPVPLEASKGKVFTVQIRRDQQRPDSFILVDCIRLSNCGYADQ